jgi:DegV family protein with EDD domain
VDVVTDSASMITPLFRGAYGIGVVPMVIVIDGAARREGVDVDALECYDALRRGALVTTSAPSPGELLACFDELARGGADEVVSIHTGSQYSAVTDAARIASGMASIPVHVVDTGSVSFAVALAARAAARALTGGGTACAAASAATRAASASGSVFIVGAAALARRGGRFASAGPVDEASVLASDSEGVRVIGQAAHIGDAIDQMVRFLADAATRNGPLCVAVGHAECRPLADMMHAGLAGEGGVSELLRYEVGPSIAAHTGLGTVGAVFAPADEL